MKFIAITMRVDHCGVTYQEKRDAVDQKLLELVGDCGFYPILLPNNLKVAKQVLTIVKLSGLIFSGGNDLVSYGGSTPERDELEVYLLEHAMKTQTPLLTICRGTQLLMDYFGQPLVKIDGHVGSTHTIMYREESRVVNSYHNLGFYHVPQEFAVEAKATDGVIKAIKHNTYPIVGIMWHPERESEFSQYDVSLIKEVFNS
ncbi:gamma-glutamyl-gamma-aminobutyrate hydrolase family protein [Pseudoalteromonas sp. McH1-7]|uniref:gamma-glutamyl-gamma-aminobutyrate hydrolase family protein n=1 Tax=unclassified Pseudoalteromonas TaxID=194690 RepID=UPI000FFE5EF2|nr:MULTISPECIES: gamma-glutamyl-gamma-aminobutyrate hydrolase family protein [unclassified Pseudoalteromonas]NUZ09590.1 gamma-glutamyl-gamma-aminobutyrate hydrolase family protein [Pseudoalteromonas sp. McH1-7]RXF07184.1 hypothetical protein D9603_00405 [Pseudoalteromonas sp. PS5]USD29620.1 gamma-glutamyl-gamma-aminobutyrate hydrolase family protein [Pseudoalteromonas sp. SCSIO 43201]